MSDLPAPRCRCTPLPLEDEASRELGEALENMALHLERTNQILAAPPAYSPFAQARRKEKEAE